MEEQIRKLKSDTAVNTLRAVARRWIEERGLDVFAIIEATRRKVPSAYDNAPGWLSALPHVASEDLDTVSRIALHEIITGTDAQARYWVEESLADAREAAAQSATAMAVITGLTLIGLVLAARVKRIGNVEFGPFPKELVDFLREARGLLLPWASDATGRERPGKR